MGKVFQTRKAWERANQAYTDALALDPQNANALDALANILLAQGDWKGALEKRYLATLAAPERTELRKQYEDLLAKMNQPMDPALGEEIVVGGESINK